MAVIEILKRGNKFRAQFRDDKGRVDAIAGISEDTQQNAKRKCLSWKQQVNRASIKVVPFSPLPPSEETSDESIHGGDSAYTVEELMNKLKPALTKLALGLGVEVDSNDTKAVIAQGIVDKQNEPDDDVKEEDGEEDDDPDAIGDENDDDELTITSDSLVAGNSHDELVALAQTEGVEISANDTEVTIANAIIDARAQARSTEA